MFGRLFGKKDPLSEAADALLAQVIAQSRRKTHYCEGGVPDTLEGRFEMMVVAAFPVFYRLKSQGEQAERLSQMLFDRMFREIDMALREMGVGDLSVPRKIKAMAQGFYGRVIAYERALEADDMPGLRDAVARNVFASLEGEPDAACVDYAMNVLKDCFETVSRLQLADILEGRLPYGGETASRAA